MTRLSSIFSFDTLRLRGGLGAPKAMLLALVLLVGAELTARHALHRGWIKRDPSLPHLIEDQRADIARHPDAVWLLGNSTLAVGVDEKQLASATGIEMVKLIHGSATVRASKRMLEYYLAAAPKPPRQLLFFVNIDDLNINGDRTERSQGYIQFCNHRPFEPLEYLVLCQSRASISSHLEKSIDHLLGIRPYDGDQKPAHFSGIIEVNDYFYSGLVKKFELDRQAIQALVASARSHGIQKVTVVLMPCTDAYVRFHDLKSPQISYQQIRESIRAMCAACQAGFLDFGEPSDRYADFADAFHMRAPAREAFTEKLVATRIIADSRPPSTRESAASIAAP